MQNTEDTNHSKVWTLQALTDIWTGDANRSGGRLITTGLLGSIRWWFEVLVRGLGGVACDPTRDGNRCPGHQRKPTDPGHHCVACELFGCTGWARKFRFEVLGRNGETKTLQIEEGDTFQLRFTELRPMKPEEWVLLDVTLRLIADYGAIGGKTVLKPSDEPSRANAAHHRDYGLIVIQERPENTPSLTRKELKKYISQRGWHRLDHDHFGWASLQNFWSVKNRYLARQAVNKSTFQELLGRKSDKSVKEKKGKRIVRWSDLLDNPEDNFAKWLAGKQQESKKVFSFKNPECARRTFGFVRSQNEFGETRRRLKEKAWSDLRDDEFLTGSEILVRLLGRGGTP